MAEAKEVKNSFTFVKGFITEASGLNFPEDASIDEENFELFKDGSRRKRLGVDFDTVDLFAGDSIVKTTIDTIATTSFLWEGAGEDGNISILVIQQGSVLFFLNAGGPDIGPIATTTVDLGIFSKSTSFQNTPLSYTSSGNRLFITSSDIVPLYIKHSTSSPFAVATGITILVRDLDGLDDGRAVEERPQTITINTPKYYNLLNQGWTTTASPGNLVTAANNADGSGGIQQINNTADYFKEITNGFPSNTDTFPLYKLESALEPVAVGAYWPAEAFKFSLGNSKAPRGHNILNPFFKTRLFSGEPVEIINAGPEGVAFYAGRVFHAQGSKVYYSQVIVDDTSIGKCFQSADPTAEDINALVDTDGGEVTISEASGIKQLITFSDKLVIFAQNGVWSIDGADAPFSATNLRVSKISDTGVSSSLAAVAADDFIFYTALSGIYTVSYDQSNGLLTSQNISQTTIQTFYNNEIAPGVLTVKGKYDRLNKKMFWMFNDGTSFSKYSEILILDIPLGAFYKHRIGNLDGEAPFITDFKESSNTELVVQEFNIITSSGDTVVDSALNQVIAEEDRFLSKTSIFDFLAYRSEDATNYGLGSASFEDLTFVDWASQQAGGASYEAFVTTGFDIGKDLIRKKQSPVIQAAFNRTESRFVDNGSGGVEFDRPSSCLLTASWDWSDNTVSGKVGKEQEVYRFRRAFLAGSIGEVFDDGLPIVTSRTKLRGKGRAISLRFRSTAGKDCQLLGWAILNVGNTTV